MEDSLLKYLEYYEKLPGWIKYPVGSLYAALPGAWRYGAFYRQYQQRIGQFITAESETALSMQQKILFEQVNLAIKEVPFYRQFKPIKSMTDFQNLPIVSKTDYLANIDQFCSPDISRRLQVNTGGSSGTPLTFYIEKNVTRPKEKAHFDWFWGLWQYRSGDRILMLRGKPLAGNKLYEYVSVKKCLNVSCYELTPDNVPAVLEQIKKFRPKFIHAYPSAVDVFIRCAGNIKKDYFTALKGLFLGSEFLDPEARLRYENFFAAPVCSWYGHTECALHGGNLPGDTKLVFFPFYGHLELVDDQGNILTEPGASGRIVGTSFDNRAMPFIRYDTGDCGILAEPIKIGNIVCPVLSSIEGRSKDVIFLSDNSAVSLTAFIFGQHLKEFDRIREMQLEQSQPGELILRIVPLKEMSWGECESISSFLSASVSNRVTIDVQIVSEIEKTWRGKHRFLIQNCKNSE